MFHIAIMNENYKILPFLLIEGASQMAKNYEGLTPRDMIKTIPISKIRKKFNNAIMKMNSCTLEENDGDKSFDFDNEDDHGFLGITLAADP